MREAHTRARALLYLGECHQKLGKDPKPFYSRLVREFQDQPAVASRAAEALQALVQAPQAPPGARPGARMPVAINRIPVGIEPLEAVPVFQGRQVWVTNLGDPSLSVIDTSGNQVVETIPVAGVPVRSAISGDGAKDHEGCEQVGVSAVNVLDAITLKRIRMLAFSEGTRPNGPFCYLPGRDLTIAQVGSAMALLQLPAYSFVGSIPFRGSSSLAFAPDGATAYAPIPSEDVVAVLWFGKP